MIRSTSQLTLRLRCLALVATLFTRRIPRSRMVDRMMKIGFHRIEKNEMAITERAIPTCLKMKHVPLPVP